MKRLFVMILVLFLLLNGCTLQTEKKDDPIGAEQPQTVQEIPDVSDENKAEVADEADESNSEPTDTPVANNTDTVDPQILRIFSMKGPTSMGLVKLLQDNEAGNCLNTYESTMVTAADEVIAAIAGKKADIAMLPANAAATLYNKAAGFRVVAINTLGVLYIVENGSTIQSLDDLAGKTICLTGKGTTPEYALRYLLAESGLEDTVTLEFKSEAAEVVAAMTENVETIGLLPQPFATSACAQNTDLRIALDLTDEWASITDESILITGVTLVRTEVLESNPDAVAAFLAEYTASIDYVNANPAEASVQIETLGIVAKAAIAEKALPYCNLVCITGDEMQTKLSGYLQTLYDSNPDAIGGVMPDTDFYYTDNE